MLDYQEIRKKDGGVLIFTHLLELLLERFNVATEEELQGHLKGDHYICHCPFCEAEGHTKPQSGHSSTHNRNPTHHKLR